MPPNSDLEQLLCNPSASDAEIAAGLLAAYQALLFRLACSFLGDADDAQDAVQQALIQALVHRESFMRGSNLRAWLFTITVNACRGMLRKRKTRQALVRLFGLEEDAPDPTPDPEAAWLAKEAAGGLWAAVDRLPEKQRWAVHLRFEQELTVAEVAQVLRISEKTVYARLYEAFRLLRTNQEASSNLRN
jgi:RNA polymerase sigma factor (sigma-70 family)